MRENQTFARQRMIQNYLMFYIKLFPDSLHPSRSPDAPQAKSGKFGHAWASLGMTNPKCSTQPLPFMDVYQHAKNQSEGSTPSRDVSDQRFLQSDWSRAFWAITREPDFSETCGFLRMIEDHKDFHFKQ